MLSTMLPASSITSIRTWTTTASHAAWPRAERALTSDHASLHAHGQAATGRSRRAARRGRNDSFKWRVRVQRGLARQQPPCVEATRARRGAAGRYHRRRRRRERVLFREWAREHTLADDLAAYDSGCSRAWPRGARRRRPGAWPSQTDSPPASQRRQRDCSHGRGAGRQRHSIGR